MATYDLNGEESVYIDDRLKTNIDEKIIPDLKKKDFDVVFGIVGRERVGKSTFAQTFGGYIAKQLGTTFDLTNVCMSPIELQKRIENASKNEVIIYDEAHRGMASSRSLSEVNNILRNLFMEMGQLNLCVIIVLPSFFMLDKYIAIHRCRGLFYVYKRSFWVYYNEDAKRILYIKGKKNMDMNCMRFPMLRGRCYAKSPINFELYTQKKKDSFHNVEKATKADRFMAQRDDLIHYLYQKENLSQKDISNLLESYKNPLSQQEISDIIAKFDGTSP
jgi:hypothetical protein